MMLVAGLESPVGPLWLTEEDGRLVALDLSLIHI